MKLFLLTLATSVALQYQMRPKRRPDVCLQEADVPSALPCMDHPSQIVTLTDMVLIGPRLFQLVFASGKRLGYDQQLVSENEAAEFQVDQQGDYFRFQTPMGECLLEDLSIGDCADDSLWILKDVHSHVHRMLQASSAEDDEPFFHTSPPLVPPAPIPSPNATVAVAAVKLPPPVPPAATATSSPPLSQKGNDILNLLSLLQQNTRPSDVIPAALAPTPQSVATPSSSAPLDSAWFFDQNQVREYNIDINPSWLYQGMNEIFAEQYSPCTLTVGYKTSQAKKYSVAGCRRKGSVGSLRLCFDPDGKRNARCRKLSIKVDVNEFAEKGSPEHKEKFYGGMKQLIFNGMAVDKSLVSERLAYGLFETLNSTSSRAVHIKLYINAVYAGVYTLVEAIDDAFIDNRFPLDKGKGALYKEAWFRPDMKADDFEKTREFGNKTDDDYMATINKAIKAATPTSAKQVMEQYFDTTSIVNITALNTILGATDDWRLRHNFYWYIRPSDRKLVMLPWDYDRLDDPEASRPFSDTWYQIWANNDPRCNERPMSSCERTAQYLVNNNVPMSEYQFWKDVNDEFSDDIMIPINCDITTRVFSWALRDRVMQQIAVMGQQTFMARINSRMQRYVNLIAPAIAQDPDPPKDQEWEDALLNLGDYLLNRRIMLGLVRQDEADAAQNLKLRQQQKQPATVPATQMVLVQPNLGKQTVITPFPGQLQGQPQQVQRVVQQVPQQVIMQPAGPQQIMLRQAGGQQQVVQQVPLQVLQQQQQPQQTQVVRMLVPAPAPIQSVQNPFAAKQQQQQQVVQYADSYYYDYP